MSNTDYYKYINRKEILRTRSEPIFNFNKPIKHNGLIITYIGSEADNINKTNMIRDFILVEISSKTSLSNRMIKSQAFYRSTGTSDFHNERNGVWFPCEGWVYKLNEGIWVNKGGDISLNYNWDNYKLTNNKKGNKYNFYYNDNVPLIKSFQEYFMKFNSDNFQTHSIWRSIIKNVVGRFQNEENFMISMLLGGGKLWEVKSSSTLGSLFEFRKSFINTNENYLDKPYKIPTTRIFKKKHEINSSIGANNENGQGFTDIHFNFQEKIWKTFNNFRITRDLKYSLDFIYKTRIPVNLPDNKKIFVDKREDAIEYGFTLEDINVFIENNPDIKERIMEREKTYQEVECLEEILQNNIESKSQKKLLIKQILNNENLYKIFNYMLNIIEYYDFSDYQDKFYLKLPIYQFINFYNELVKVYGLKESHSKLLLIINSI